MTDATSADLDVSPAAERLRYFRFAEYVLVFAAISAVGWLILFFILLAGHEAVGQFGAGFSVPALILGVLASLAAIYLGVMAYCGAGRLRPAIMRRYMRTLPLIGLVLLGTGVLFFMQGDNLFKTARKLQLTSGLIAMQGYDFWTGQIQMTPELQAQLDERAAQVQALHQNAVPLFLQGDIALIAGITAFVGLWGLSRFKRARIGQDSNALAQLETIDAARKAQAPPAGMAKPINRPLGMLLLAAASAMVIVPQLLPLGDFGTIGNLAASGILGLILGIAAFFAVFRAKQYFQVSADSLLASDKRKPILFLRSFSDDPKVVAASGVGHEGLAQLMDLSVETRLANHFMTFGPFIAVGSPQDKVPQLGAARKRLSDEDWQQAVTTWMKEASVIVMYAGTTHWVGWELKQILAGGYAEKLILLFPPVLPFPGFRHRSWLRKQMPDVEKRFETTKAAFAGTPWEAAWSEIGSPETVICVRFLADGKLAVTRSTRRSKDAYELAAELAHLGIIGRQRELAPAS